MIPSRQQLIRGALLLAGLVVPQFMLYGPSLTGQKVLLPLDILQAGTFYIPPGELRTFRTDDGQLPPMNPFRPHNESLSDQILSYEIERQFVASEFRAGRIPLWTPYNYAGAPFVNWPKYSPFNLMYSLVPTPYVLAWIQLVKSLIAGIGAWLFFRHGLSLGFWPSTIAAWCFPLTGHFAVWQGYPQTYVTVWLPWLLLVVDRVVQKPRSLAGPILAVVTALVTISGQLDTAGHVLLASGVYAIHCLIREYRLHLRRKQTVLTVAVLIGSWGTGFLLAAPELLPLAEYSLNGSRLGDTNEILNGRGPYRTMVGNGNWPIAFSVAAVQLGAARRALDEAQLVLAQKIEPAGPLTHNSGIQVDFMEVQARWHAAHALMERELASMWDHAEHDGELPGTQRVRINQAATNANRTSVEVIQVITRLTGTATVDPNHPLSRCSRDVLALQGHIGTCRRSIEMAAEYQFGIRDTLLRLV